MASKRSEYLLRNLPSPVKNFAMGLNSYLHRNKKYGRIYQEDLIQLRKNFKLSHEHLVQVQTQSLSHLLSQVFIDGENDYARTMRDADITLDFINDDPMKALSLIPRVEKLDFKANLKRFTLSSVDVFSVTQTSGTSGSPMVVPYDESGFQKGFSCWRRFYDLMGLPSRFRNMRFSGRVFTAAKNPKPNQLWVNDWFERRLFASTYHMTDQNLKAYVDKLNRYKPELIDGYPSALEVLARFIETNNLNLECSPIAIACTAETLFQTQRELIERVFGCKIFNQYASSEGGPWITECREGQLHLNLDTGVFEFRYVEEESEFAELVVTSFRNRKIPLIRYCTGDVVTDPKYPGPCACGLDTPTVKEIIGRTDDILESTERGLVGRLDPVYKGVVGINQSQIQQVGIDVFRMLIVPESNFTESELGKLKANFHDRLGLSVKLEIEMVDSIPHSKNGKFRSVVRLDSKPPLIGS